MEALIRWVWHVSKQTVLAAVPSRTPTRPAKELESPPPQVSAGGLAAGRLHCPLPEPRVPRGAWGHGRRWGQLACFACVFVFTVCSSAWIMFAQTTREGSSIEAPASCSSVRERERRAAAGRRASSCAAPGLCQAPVWQGRSGAHARSGRRPPSAVPASFPSRRIPAPLCLHQGSTPVLPLPQHRCDPHTHALKHLCCAMLMLRLTYAAHYLCRGCAPACSLVQTRL